MELAAQSRPFLSLLFALEISKVYYRFRAKQYIMSLILLVIGKTLIFSLTLTLQEEF